MTQIYFFVYLWLPFDYKFKISSCALQSKRALSSVGSEHLVYTQGVGSSNLSAPTNFSWQQGLQDTRRHQSLLWMTNEVVEA